jgi:hypothetical protein
MGAAAAVVESPRTINAMVMRIVTKFTTVEDFVQSFARFCADASCFIPSAQAKRVGVETAFSIRLADGTPMLRGLCVVLESWATPENPFGRPGVQLGIRKLTPESKLMFQQLRRVHHRREDTMRVEVPSEVFDELAKSTVQMPPLFPEPAVFEDHAHGEEDSGGIPEPIDAIDSLPAADATVPVSRPPAMTLLGVTPLEPVKPRPVAPRVAMPALSTEIRITPAPRRGMWARVWGRVRAVVRQLRWAYRRRRGVRASVRRLPTRT